MLRVTFGKTAKRRKAAKTAKRRKIVRKSSNTRCRHAYGEWRSDPDDDKRHRTCEECGAVQFEGERRAYTGWT